MLLYWILGIAVIVWIVREFMHKKEGSSHDGSHLHGASSTGKKGTHDDKGCCH